MDLTEFLVKSGIAGERNLVDIISETIGTSEVFDSDNLNREGGGHQILD